MIVSLLKGRESNRERLYRISKACIGLDIGRYYNKLSCMEVVNKLVELATKKPILTGLVSTIRGLEILTSDNRFREVSKVEDKIFYLLPGLIIISATEGKNIGHCGIISDNGKILSNNSINGRLEEHWTHKRWLEHFSKKKGLSVRYFRVI